MPYLKKLVMHGFKSFAAKTEILFENAMNVIVGPNGSGKSNIADALCFVLGRLSIKSIRAAKAANLLFSGNKTHKPSPEASVELIFDNSDKSFGISTSEISIKRIVRRNGLSIYKINNETKTRQELIELLAQSGIDPNGFNIVLQGEIASLVKMSSEDRRKIIEEVAGISIYETRKQKSLREIEKTEEKLKEVAAVLKERNTYLRNLEKERQEALSYQKLEQTIKRCKATLHSKNIQEKQKQLDKIKQEIQEQEVKISKIKEKIQDKNSKISELDDKINKINKIIQLSTSNEQEEIHRELSDLKADFAGLSVRKENFEARLQEAEAKKSEFQSKIKELESEVERIQTSSPEIKKQQTKLKENQDKFDKLERERKRFYLIRSEISSLENRRSEKQKHLIEIKKELEIIERNISSLFDEIKYEKSEEKSVLLKQKTKQEIEKLKQEIIEFEKERFEIEKENAVIIQTVSKEEKLKIDILKLDTCPLCRNQITETHRNYVLTQSNELISKLSEKQEKDSKSLEKLSQETLNSRQILSEKELKLNEIEIDLMKIRNADEKKEQIKKLSENLKNSEQELKQLNEKIHVLRQDFEKIKNIEQDYDETRLKLQELSFVDVDADTEITIKQREINRLKVDLKSVIRDSDDSNQELKQLNEKITDYEEQIEKQEKREQEIYDKFQKMFTDKNAIQDEQKAIETELIGLQHEIRSHEEKINLFKINRAQVGAQLDSIKFEAKEFESIEIYTTPIEEVQDRLNKAQVRILDLRNVNLRALETYDKIKEQCEEVEKKVQTIEAEKQQIQKIIDEIDKKKKKSFTKTLDAVNEYFTRNFTQLSKKGEVFLELENKQDPFAAGLNILIKVARGKYFDVKSLSGGEQTLVALSLIFAIQEYNPYCFYIFDEIDAALDKHNSERLAALIKQYMTSGQYVIVTHNDALISEASTLYGVSMQENISKVISLKI